ncbi:hypothetical protein ElyMa_003223300 [Elysia marginata]|uniref:Uncharacterized protein n=1 Tax=Elysia marginata TaxID=1093978 RepID=A0AAV4J224_9GAST|nr:hypothetical protein ElyMa_003223300 [Elysia marginata]
MEQLQADTSYSKVPGNSEDASDDFFQKIVDRLRRDIEGPRSRHCLELPKGDYLETRDRRCHGIEHLDCCNRCRRFVLDWEHGTPFVFTYKILDGRAVLVEEEQQLLQRFSLTYRQDFFLPIARYSSNSRVRPRKLMSVYSLMEQRVSVLPPPPPPPHQHLTFTHNLGHCGRCSAYILYFLPDDETRHVMAQGALVSGQEASHGGTKRRAQKVTNTSSSGADN